MLDPVIKWSGSKRSQAKEIVSRIGDGYDTYYEPFCGGCSVLWYILNNCPNKFKSFICNDYNDELIATFQRIMSNWRGLFDNYRELWSELNFDDNMNRRKRMFNDIRDELNRTHDPDLFFFIMRTTTKGMPRYNSDGQFNNSFHFSRKGMEPKRMMKILEKWSDMLNKYNVRFLNYSYYNINDVKKNDFMYLDPPYANAKGMYYGVINYSELWDYMRKLPCDYMLSFDGTAGDENNVYDVPKDVYDEHLMLPSGKSSFRRLHSTPKDVAVYESLYVKHNLTN